MDIRKISVVAAALIAALVLSSSPVFANPAGEDSEHGKAFKEKMEAKKQELYRDLNITDAQKKLLEENRNKRKGQAKALFNEMKEKRALMREEIQKDTLDIAKINQLNDELKKMQARMLDDKLERILEVRKILTPEQYKKFITKMEEKGNHFKNKRRGSKGNG